MIRHCDVSDKREKPSADTVLCQERCDDLRITRNHCVEILGLLVVRISEHCDYEFPPLVGMRSPAVTDTFQSQNLKNVAYLDRPPIENRHLSTSFCVHLSNLKRRLRPA